ncbi:hypothetical protein [Nostoc sp. NZL]|uniref:hypothetical protein n=1 Tax=Nostoc sp. NZL TaxID=2650612 RepID=UPI001E4731F4|nr:hypothetical protein [Nostoc sp. NZL]
MRNWIKFTTQGCVPSSTHLPYQMTLVIENFDNPIAPLVIEQLPLPIVPQGVLAPVSLAIAKPEGYLSYNTSTQSANLFWPKNSANNQKITQAKQYTYHYLIWGDVTRIVTVGNIGWFVSFMLFHLGLWLRRDRSEVLLPRICLGILLLEVVGGLAWGWLNLLIGLLFPIGVMGIDAVIRRVNFPPFHPSWWMLGHY